MTQEDPSSRLTGHTVTGTTVGLHSVSGPYQMVLRTTTPGHSDASVRQGHQVALSEESSRDRTVGGALRGDFEGTSSCPGGSPGPGSSRGPSIPGEGTMLPSHHPVPHCPRPGLRAPGKHSLQGPSPHSPGRTESESRAATPSEQKLWWELLTDIWGPGRWMRFKAKGTHTPSVRGRCESSLQRPTFTVPVVQEARTPRGPGQAQDHCCEVHLNTDSAHS